MNYFIIHREKKLQIIELENPDKIISLPYAAKFDSSWIEMRKFIRHTVKISIGIFKKKKMFFYIDAELDPSIGVEILMTPPHELRKPG